MQLWTKFQNQRKHHETVKLKGIGVFVEQLWTQLVSISTRSLQENLALSVIIHKSAGIIRNLLHLFTQVSKGKERLLGTSTKRKKP